MCNEWYVHRNLNIFVMGHVCHPRRLKFSSKMYVTYWMKLSKEVTFRACIAKLSLHNKVSRNIQKNLVSFRSISLGFEFRAEYFNYSFHLATNSFENFTYCFVSYRRGKYSYRISLVTRVWVDIGPINARYGSRL